VGGWGLDTINRLTARFDSAEIEHHYRQEFLAADKKKIFTVLSIVVFFGLAFFISDLQVARAREIGGILLLARLAMVAFVAVSFLICRRSQDEKLIDRMVLITVILSNALISLINCTRPPDYYTYLLIDLVAIFVVYLYIPNRFLYQLFPVILFNLSEMLIFLYLKGNPGPVSLLAIAVAFLVANVTGLLASHSRHLSNRQLFSSWVAEKKLRQKYEEALGQIKTLSGLLPICSSCKRIRDEQGNWTFLEIYISEHSQAEFTHGLCPDCLHKLYPGFSDKV